MKWTHAFTVFLFDFDGLLVDTESLHFQAYQKMCERHGVTLSWSFDKFCQLAHTDAFGIQRALAEEYPLLAIFPWPVLYEEKKQAYIDLLNQGALKLMPGVAPLLQELARRDVKRAVVTHSHKALTDAIRAHLPLLDTIPLWITREDYDLPKPHPMCYQKAIALLAEPDDIIIGFEDSLRGLRALQEAGVKSILICSRHHPQLGDKNIGEVSHFESFEQISSL